MAVNNAYPNVRVYQGNQQLKAAGQVIEYTPWQIEEIKKCIADPVYFAKHYVKIVHVDEGLIGFDMWDFQIKMIHSFNDNRFNIGKLPRQCGKTQTAATYILWYILFNEHKTAAVLANKAAAAREILNRIKISFEGLPFWLQQGVVEWNKGTIELSNGCVVLSAASSGSAIRGKSVSLLYLDEFAFLPPNQAMEFFESVYPTISSGKNTKVIMTSTPKGMNHFYKFWIEASEGRSEFKPIEIFWNDVPGRGEEFRQKTIANIGEDSWEQEFCCEFMGSSGSLISPKFMKLLAFKSPIKELDKFKIYVEPIENHKYIVVADISEGVGGDNTAINVIDITEYPYKQTAIFYDNKTSPLVLADIIYQIAKKYNEAFVLIEIQSMGQAVANTLFYDLEYEGVLFCSSAGNKGIKLEFGNSNQRMPGLRTTKTTKKIGCSGLKNLVEEQKLELYDYTTIEELSVFIRKGDTFQAEDGFHDDSVMSLCLLGWVVSQTYFKELLDRNIRDIYKTVADTFEEDMLTIGRTGGYFEPEVEVIVDSSGIHWAQETYFAT
jgi:hypothetical protein